MKKVISIRTKEQKRKRKKEKAKGENAHNTTHNTTHTTNAMGDKEKKIDIEHSKHPLVSYKDPTENTWAILKPVLDSKSSVQKLAWGNYIIRKLKFDFVSTEEIPPNSSKRIEDFYKQPFVDMLILDGDVKKIE